MILARHRVTCCALSLLLSCAAWSERRRDPLTPLEVDQLRDTAMEPDLRLKLYIKFARARLASLEQVRSDPKVTNRGQETHDRLQDFLDVYDELNENIDTYVGRKAELRNVKAGLLQSFQETYCELRPRAPMPEIGVEFFAFANINNTIRLRGGKLFVRISDLLEGAPEPVLRAIAHILLAKMYRRPIEREHATRYRRYVSSRAITRKAHLIRQLRGRKRIKTAQVHTYDLEA